MTNATRERESKGERDEDKVRAKARQKAPECPAVDPSSF
jgi:hypothetical protein